VYFVNIDLIMLPISGVFGAKLSAKLSLNQARTSTHTAVRKKMSESRIKYVKMSREVSKKTFFGRATRLLRIQSAIRWGPN